MGLRTKRGSRLWMFGMAVRPLARYGLTNGCSRAPRVLLFTTHSSSSTVGLCNRFCQGQKVTLRSHGGGCRAVAGACAQVREVTAPMRLTPEITRINEDPKHNEHRILCKMLRAGMRILRALPHGHSLQCRRMQERCPSGDVAFYLHPVAFPL